MTGALVLCATSLDGATGGVAASNGTLRAAMRSLAGSIGAPLRVLTLHDAAAGAPDTRAFRGDRLGFAAAALGAAARARLVVFDHVHLAAPLLAAPSALRPPHAVIAHGSEVGRRLRARSRRSLRAADLVLANSEHTLANLRRAAGSPLGVACPLGLPAHIALTPSPPGAAETEAAQAGLRLEAADGGRRAIGPRMLLLVGRMEASEGEKGHREMIAALPALRAAHPDAQLVLVGGGDDEAALRALAADSAAAAAIFLTGHAPQPLLERLHRAAYAYAMPSRQEGFGLVYLEAMNQAKPCLACRGDGGADIVLDGETGLLVDQPLDLGQLTAALDQLLRNPEKTAELGEAGWRRLAQNFTAAAHQARLEAHFSRLLQDAAPRRAGRAAMVGPIARRTEG